MDDEVHKTEKKEEKITITLSPILSATLYVFGIIAIVVAFYWYNKDLNVHSDGDPFRFYEKTYVGGDAYNYIISASRSTSVIAKGLFWMILGCSSIICGRLFSLKHTSCK